MSHDLKSQLQTTLGDAYRVDRELPGAGMSRVFVAHDRTLGRDVVVKVLPPDMAAAVSVQRFNREIQLAAKLQHPHIVPLHATGEISGLPYFTMPFVEGESLRAHLSRQGELPLAECVRILRDVATALAYAHKQGVVHRDIKPENVLLTSGSAVVTDFGVGKALSASTTSTAENLTTRGVAVGTPAYMSPEQASADPGIDHRSDIYSWGILAYEMIAGQPPFAGRGPGALIAAQIAETPESVERRRPTVPHALGSLVMRCLAKRPADRPQSAAELVDTLDGLLASGLTSGADLQAGRKTTWRRAQPWLGVLAGVSAVLLAAALLLAPRADLGFGSGGAAQPVRSIAVLPFLNSGGDQSDEYFSDGMSDELSTALGKIPGLQVASRTSTFTFKGAESTDVRAIGDKLKVDAVLEGRVRRSGDRLRLFVQLTNVADGLSLWSESYEREVKDVFAVQEEIARAIAGALQVRLGSDAATPTVPDAGTQDLAAYDLYLRGRYQWHRRNLLAAADLFGQAASKDPRFARAYAGVAMTYALLPEYIDFSPDEAKRRTEQAAARALALDSTLSEAYAALGLSYVHSWRWAEAEQAYKRAIALDPRHATAHQWYGEYLYHVGNMDESLAQMRLSTELDPLAPIAATAHAYALYAAGKPAESLVESKRALELAPQISLIHRVIALGAQATGDCATALQHSAISVRIDSMNPTNIGEKARIDALCGRVGDARAAVARLRRDASDRAIFPLAIAYAALGEKEQALDYLERAVQRRVISLTAWKVATDPMFDSIRHEPRFRAVLRAMNFPPEAFEK